MSKFALEVENLVKVYASRGKAPIRAVDGMSFRVPRGIIFGLLGPNGAGKSSLLRMLSTLTRPTEGTAKILGYDVVKRPIEVRKRISSVIQATAVELFLSVKDNLLTYARFQGLDKATAERRADALIEEFQLGPEVDRKVQDLSGGFRRRVQVAKVFMVDTPVLFLDEFSTGMDPILKRAVMDRLRQEAAKGRTIVLTTQILSEAEELCDDILIMNHGREVAHGDLQALKLLSEGVYEVSMTFEVMPGGLAAELSALQPLRLTFTRTTVHFAMKESGQRVLAIVSDLATRGRVRQVEIGGA